MSFIKNARIKTKILAPIVCLIVLFAAGLSYMAIEYTHTDDNYTHFIAHESKATTQVALATRHLQSVAYRAYQFTGNPLGTPVSATALESYRSNSDWYKERLNNAIELLPNEKEKLQKFVDDGTQALKFLDAAVDLHMKGQLEGIKENILKADPIIDELTGAQREWSDALSASVEAQAKQMSDDTNETILFNVIGMALVTLLALIGTLYISQRGITSPLASLRERMQSLAEGDLTVVIDGQDRKDEIGDMAQAVQVFKENGLKARQLEADAAALREANEAERARVEAEKAREAAEDKVSIEALAAGLSALAQGDLTHRITAEISAKSIRLKEDFNASIEKLQDTLLTITASIGAIHAGTGEVSTAADDLSRRTEQQAASLEETAAALDQITSTVKNTADGAVHARDVVSVAKADAEKSGEVVRQAIDAMGMIEKSSEQISQIIGVIDEIAFQTNLLALNAGVEAARAGDAGRGFAVVASEVRALAQRSAEAAKEIKNLISASTTQVDQGVELVGQTGKALERIVTQVAEINTVVVNIAASAHEQSTGLEQVNSAVNQMDQVTQQNAAMVEESTAASHSLAQETNELSRLVSAFKLGNVTSFEAGRTRGQRPSRTARPAVKSSGSPRLATAGNTALAEEGWEEF